MSDTRGEGCGVWPLLLKGGKFAEACEWHDKAYSEESWSQLNLSRVEVDRWFKAQMLYIAEGSPLRKVQAHFFYCVVRLVGHLWWEGKR